VRSGEPEHAAKRAERIPVALVLLQNLVQEIGVAGFSVQFPPDITAAVRWECDRGVEQFA